MNVKKDHYLIRDVEGFIRFPDNLKLNKEQSDELSEKLYIITTKDIGITQLNETFKEYDQSRGIKTKGGGRKWTDEEERYVLLHHEDGDDEVGAELGRTGMSIFMHKSGLLSDFDSWKQDKVSSLVGLTREQIVDMFLGDFEEDE
jgi:hypothetical protein